MEKGGSYSMLWNVFARRRFRAPILSASSYIETENSRSMDSLDHNWWGTLWKNIFQIAHVLVKSEEDWLGFNFIIAISKIVGKYCYRYDTFQCTLSVHTNWISIVSNLFDVGTLRTIIMKLIGIVLPNLIETSHKYLVHCEVYRRVFKLWIILWVKLLLFQD